MESGKLSNYAVRFPPWGRSDLLELRYYHIPVVHEPDARARKLRYCR